MDAKEEAKRLHGIGHSYFEIAAALNKAGTHPAPGLMWIRSDVEKILGPEESNQPGLVKAV